MERRGRIFLSKADEAGIGRDETASTEVEIAKMRVEIHMQPFAPRRLGVHHRFFDQPRGVAHPSLGRGDHRVEQEGVNAAVPCDIDEACEHA